MHVDSIKINEYKPLRDKVRKYIETYLYDSVHGGYFWEVSSQGDVIVSKKQVYAQAFVIYAYAEYYLAFGDTSALQSAMDLFTIMESNCIDKVYGGYFEAFSQSWDKLDDVRLSERDLNLPKGMNTNLHVLEAYTTLYEATKLNK
jgi:mannobiose 2-epimerase